MNREIDIKSKVSLAPGEKIIKKYAEWQSKRPLPIISLVLGAIFFLLFISSDSSTAKIMGFLILIGSVGYFFYKYQFSPLLTCHAWLTDRRILLFYEQEGKFTDEFTIESLKLNSIIGFRLADGLILQDELKMEDINGTTAEQVFSDIMEMRYN